MSVQVALVNDGRFVRLSWPDGVSREIAARWLFDHADDARDSVSGQRGHGALALGGSSRLGAVEIDGDQLLVRFSPSGAQRRIGLRRLRDNIGRSRLPVELWLTPEPITKAAPKNQVGSVLGLQQSLTSVAQNLCRLRRAILNGGWRSRRRTNFSGMR